MSATPIIVQVKQRSRTRRRVRCGALQSFGQSYRSTALKCSSCRGNLRPRVSGSTSLKFSPVRAKTGKSFVSGLLVHAVFPLGESEDEQTCPTHLIDAERCITDSGTLPRTAPTLQRYG